MSTSLNDFTSSFNFPVRSLVDLVRWRAIQQPNRRLYTFLGSNGEQEEGFLTYRNLEERARAIAAQLMQYNMIGQRALLLYAPGQEIDFIAAFFGCLYAGVVAVPVYPPDPSRLNRSLPRLLAIVHDAQPTVALTTSSILSMVEYVFAEDENFRSVRWLATDKVDTKKAEEWEESDLGMETLAFLQYTSGSTATPKGVMVTHGNLLLNERGIRKAFKLTEESIGVGWLPLYHDMGLIGTVIQPLYIGFHVVLMSPLAFLQKPVCWLQAISRYRATASGGPNFAYELCTRKVTEAERAELDLSSWQLAFNGAEPIRYETMMRFADTFAACGFRREALYPCYGLAEATLFVSGGMKSSIPIACTVDEAALGRHQVVITDEQGEHTRTIVGCGQTIVDQQIVIVNTETLSACGNDEVGEIWVKGPSVAQGYWQKPAETTRTFQAYLADGRGPFLRTGDLGFMRDNELFITGRLKDVIIIRGRNYYPQDIEWTTEHSHASVRSGCTAAFSIEIGGEEQLVVVAEVERRSKAREADSLKTIEDVSPVLANKESKPFDADAVVRAIRQAISEHHQLTAHAVVLIKAKSINKTSSGKIQRHACKAAFLSGDLDIIESSLLSDKNLDVDDRLTRAELLAMTESTRRARLERYMRNQLVSIIRISPDKLGDIPLITFGLDSLMAVELKNRIETDLGINVSLANFLQGPSIAQLTAMLLAQIDESAPTASIVATRDDNNEQPLSYNQQSLWFINQLAPESAAYNLSFAVRVMSELDSGALARAFQSIVDRHATLRTSYHLRAGQPFQKIHRSLKARFVEIDTHGWSEDEINSYLQSESLRPFDLAQAPLLCVHLLRRSAQDHLLLIVVHHIAIDFWSLVVMMDELSQFYTAECRGKMAVLPPPILQYSDYARWQKERLASAEGELHWQYWQQQLSGELPVLNLPTDRPRPPVQTYRGNSHAFKVNKNRLAALKELARREGVTLYTLLLAVYQTLLYRYTGQHDIIVGSPSAGRERAELAELVGYFINTLTLRADFRDDPTFSELLGRTRAAVIAGIEHEAFPFPLMVERLQPERDASRTPIFQTVFVLEKPHRLPESAPFVLGEAGARMQLGELALSSVALDQRVAQFDLTLIAVETDGSLAASLQYNSDLFDAATMARMAEHFQALLSAITDNPAARVSALPLLSDSERRQLLVEWNNTAADYPRDKPIHELIPDSDAIAVTFNDQQITYRALNERANQLAHHLRASGVKPDEIVAISMERSIDMVVAILGVLKAGGAYLPIDPAYPQERIDFMLADARPVVVLRALPDLSKYSVDTPVTTTTPDNLAYVIYTSGSTGKPKGAMLEHGGLVNLVKAQIEAFQIDSNSRVLQFASISFDAAVSEIFTALVAGATLCLTHTEDVTALLRKESITTVTLPPALLAVIDADNLPALRTVVSAGEACRAEIVNRWARGRRFLNAYGPTETTVCATFAQCHIDEPITIGRPIANTHIYILDDFMQPVPVGVAGEIYIGGAGVARGYLNRPELTQEKFIKDTFNGDGRLYRSGDLGRYLPDGAIEYLGRTDQQVKIRGYRIEPGEIESALNAHEAISEAAVIDREDNGNRRLVAYIVSPEPLDPDELRVYLKAKLPEYMVPAFFIKIDALPLTPNGKLDRRALPAPGAVRAERTFATARNSAEEVFTRIWAELLRLESVGINDNFFALGGDSIMTIQIAAQAARQGYAITPSQIFQHQTIAELVSVARPVDTAEGVQAEISGDAPLTPIQRWFFSFTESHHWNQALMLRLEVKLTPELLEQALAAVFAHHDALRLRFIKSANGWRQTHASADEVLHLSVTDLSANSGEAAQEVIEARARQLQTSLNISAGPLARAELFRHAGNEADQLFIVIHHLAVDSVSWRILIEDLEVACQQLRRGEKIRLAGKTTAFKTWAAALVARAGEMADQFDYWQRASESPAEIPADFPEGENSEASAQTITISFTEAETDSLLRDLARVYRAQISDGIIAALAQALAGRNQARAFSLDLEGHGRDDLNGAVDLSRTVGWFTALYPFQIDAANIDHPGQAVKSIKERRRAVPQQGIGYGLLAYVADNGDWGERLAARPRTIAFNYLGQLDNRPQGESMLALSDAQTGPLHSPRARRPYLIEINGRVTRGRLTLDFIYSANIHKAETIAAFAREVNENLKAIMTHCREAEAGSYTPADFPLARLNQGQLDQLLRQAPGAIDIYPLSPLQQGLLFHALYEPQAGSYLMQLSCELSGDLETAAFARAWQEIVDRHTVLRTSFAWQSLPEPMQIVHNEARLPFQQLDWRKLPVSEQRQQLREFLHTEQTRGFDLAQPPLMRIALIRMADDRYQFVWNFHHLLLDGWCLAMLMQEVSLLYKSFAAGEEITLTARRSYRDYIAWLQQKDLSSAAAYWRSQLQGITAATPLGIDRAAEDGTPLYSRNEVRLTASFTERLQSFARSNKLTLYTLIQSAWALLLSVYSNRAEVVFGVNVSGRGIDLAGVDSMLGLFINTFPARIKIEADTNLIEWMRKIQALMAEARRYEYTPLVEIKRWSELPKDQPLFESLLGFDNYPLDFSRWQECGIEIGHSDFVDWDSFPLSIQAIPGNELKILIKYDTRRIDTAAIERLAGDLEFCLLRMVEAPVAKLAELTGYFVELRAQQQAEKQRDIKESSRQKLKAIRRRAVNAEAGAQIQTSFFAEGERLPLVIQPQESGAELLAWVKEQRDFIESELVKHGALLFRNFSVPAVADFEKVVAALSQEMLEYRERSSPRSQVTDRIYTSTDYPADQSIFLHNENSYQHVWPLHLFFYCASAPQQGGETPIADCRRVYQRIDAKVRARFEEKGVMYVRNFREGLGLSWQTVFQTNDRCKVEEYCRQAGIETEWVNDNWLRTRAVRKAIARHPRTGELSWFNHTAFFHISTLPGAVRNALLAKYREEDLPSNSYYGDGTTIDADDLEEIRRAYFHEIVSFRWQFGDLMLIDNMLTAHGRSPYQGARKIFVGMSDPVSDRGV